MEKYVDEDKRRITPCKIFGAVVLVALVAACGVYLYYVCTNPEEKRKYCKRWGGKWGWFIKLIINCRHHKDHDEN